MAAATEASSSSSREGSDVIPKNLSSSLSGSEEEREAKALLGWVQSVDNASEEDVLSRVVTSTDDLCDGVAFFDILSAVDPAFFRNPHTADTKDNWVLKIGTLKRLHKLVLQYYSEVLEQSPQALASPDLDVLARNSSPVELCKLGRLVIGIAVRSERASEHITAIQTLPLEDQQQLMFAIEQVMEALQGLENAGEPLDTQQSPVTVNGDLARVHGQSDGEARMERLYLELVENHKSLQSSLDDTIAEKEEASRELARFREEVERERNTHADVLMRQEIERLKEQLRKSEDNLAVGEAEIERMAGVVAELTRKTEDLQRRADEGAKLKDQMEEYKHASDRLQKTENVIEKYKKKLEEGADVRRQLKIVEAQYTELVDRNATVEDEYKRVAAFKPLMDSYKGQMAEMESKASALQRELSSTRYDLEQVTSKLRATEEARLKEKEEMDLYQERIQELELGGSVTKRKKDANGNVNGVEVLAANNESISDDEDVADENIDDALSGTTMTGLKIQVRKLARELRAAQANKADAGRLLVLENLLEDANRMKARYETDYLREYQKGLILGKKVDDILGAKSNIGDGPEANYAIRLRLNETVEELEACKKELTNLKVEHEQVSRALAIAKSDLILVDKDKLDMLESLRISISGEKTDLERRLQQIEAEMHSKDEQLRMNVSQINTLLMEKVDLQSDSMERRDDALLREREIVELRDRLDQPGVLSEAQELLRSKEAELQRVQEKLHKARNFIRQQDKMLQEATASRNSATPEDSRLKLKKLEQENSFLHVELKQMSSAWYNNQTQQIRERIMNAAIHKSGNNRAQTKASMTLMGNKPKSWLQQQRNELAGSVPLARR